MTHAWQHLDRPRLLPAGLGRHQAGVSVLLRGINHVPVLTKDTEGLQRFYREVFDAVVFSDQDNGLFRLSLIDVGPFTRLNVFEVTGNTEADRQTRMFGRGRIDHIGLEAQSQEAFDVIRGRLIAAGSSDGFVTDFGTDLSVFFTDPDGLECEVLLSRPGAVPADLRPPGTPAAGYGR